MAFLVNFAKKVDLAYERTRLSVQISVAGVVPTKHATRRYQLDTDHGFPTVIYPLRQSFPLHSFGCTGQTRNL